MITVNPNSKNKPVIFSFFSGCGLLDLGFESDGYEIALVNEISQSFLAAYKHSRSKMGINMGASKLFNVDVNTFLNEHRDELHNHIASIRQNGQLIGFIGGPPCPDFSIAGKNKGAEGLNGRLSLAYVNLIIDMMPDFFLYENVKGLWSTVRHKEFYDSQKAKLHKAGYSTAERLCNALDYGVPQDRERVIFIGVNNELLNNGITKNGCIENFPWKHYTCYDSNDVKKMPWPTTNPFGSDINPALSDAMKVLTVQHWFDKNDVENHPNSKAHFQPRAGIERMRTVPEGDVSRKSYKRLHRYRYSPTAAYGNNEVHLHPYKERRISAAEALAIQSLPKTFELPQNMSLSDMFKTIGNGVPFLLANGIAKTINIFLEENTVCRT